MSADNNIDRRQLLKSIAISGAWAKWPAMAGAASAASAPPNSYAVFSPSQALLMEALVDLLIPADDFPGAKDAGVVRFIDLKLSGPYGSFFTARYEAGLKQINEVSRQHFHQNFTALEASQQSILLHAIADKTYGDGIHEFFQTVLYDTFEGYYGNPEDGGNRDGASWKMIGFKG